MPEAVNHEFPLGQRITLEGHFDQPVILEEVRPLGNGFECRVRLPDGVLEETIMSSENVGSQGSKVRFAVRLRET